MNRANPVDLRKALDVADTLVKAGLLFVCVPVLDEADRQRLATLTATRLELIARALETGQPVEQPGTIRYFINRKSRLCRMFHGRGTPIDDSVTETLKEGFVEVTPAEQTAFQAETQKARDAGWKPFGRTSYATFIKRMNHQEADQ